MRDNLNTKQMKAIQQTTRASILLLVIAIFLFAWATPHPTNPQVAVCIFLGLGLIAVAAAEAIVTGPKKRKIAADATQGWGSDQKAVSPVIGVILMVAITVVLAAVVFTLVTQLSQHSATQGSSASFETMTPTATALPFRVIAVDSPFDWTTCVLKDQAGATKTFTVNGAAPAATPLSAAGDVLQVASLTTKTTYEFLLNCGGHTTASLHGTTA